MKKVIIFLANGFEEIEAIGTADILRRGKARVKIVSITDSKEVEGSNGIKIIADDLIENISETEYEETDMIAFPGGMGNAMSLANSEKVINIIQTFDKEEKLIGAICASPAFAIAKSGIAQGRKITCYPGLESRLSDSEYVNETVVKDKNLITSKGPGTTFQFAYTLLDELGLNSEEVKKDMIWNNWKEKKYVEGI